MTLTTAIVFAAGLALLIGGAEIFVRGASKLAAALGISPLIIGLTVVAFGTSAPELAISVLAGLEGRPDLAFGNVVGSNIFNTLFILGASALVAPLVVARRLVQLDVPLVIGASVLALVMGMDGRIGRLEGLGLFAGIVTYTIWLVLRGRGEGVVGGEVDTRPDQGQAGPGRLAIDLAMIASGLVLLVVGSRMLVSAAVTIASGLGVSEMVVGLTIVAAGTSLPEVATSLLASLKGERDIAVGNVVGSNLFNLLCVLGLTASATGGIPVPAEALRVDVPVMIASSIACMPIFFSGHRIDRWEGCLFLGYYVAYTTNLVLAATGHEALGSFQGVMVAFILPLTAITLGVITYREFRSRWRVESGHGSD
ncbi:calcium/sodium antiporter [Tautonia plasticadhaerens]|uniref:Inner membrane protein YrbG n=1 Tax=Tautonia plasticadhaerens TaxID=2527974 RepID=A0A518H8N9_9BACT|nr:calcium/sodium antiporter [Tautonia plasticadhaerens]QDV37213.1 Inner membrane protein YrbG [Tautonia plasticadhaerens]